MGEAEREERKFEKVELDHESTTADSAGEADEEEEEEEDDDDDDDEEEIVGSIVLSTSE